MTMNACEVIRQINNFTSLLSDLTENPVPLNLGQIESQLKEAIKKHPEGEQAYIRFTFGDAYPTTFDSYRGDYSELCLQYSGEFAGESTKAGDFLKEIEKAYSVTYTGWKGGEYQMDSDAEVYVACRGRCSHTRIIGIIANGNNLEIEILTAEITE